MAIVSGGSIGYRCLDTVRPRHRGSLVPSVALAAQGGADQLELSEAHPIVHEHIGDVIGEAPVGDGGLRECGDQRKAYRGA
jgi:hypothetical protein